MSGSPWAHQARSRAALCQARARMRRRAKAETMKGRPFGRPFHCRACRGQPRRAEPPIGRPSSYILPHAARDNETFDHLLSLVDDGLNMDRSIPGSSAIPSARRAAEQNSYQHRLDSRAAPQHRLTHRVCADVESHMGRTQANRERHARPEPSRSHDGRGATACRKPPQSWSKTRFPSASPDRAMAASRSPCVPPVS